MFQPNQVLDNRYQIIREIARGGMGVIYRAKDLQLQDEVALKVSLLYEEKFIEAFESEARILKGLRHTGLPQVRGYFSAEDFLVFVMEYIEGDHLLKLLEKREERGIRGLPLDEVHYIAEQLGDILDYLHGKGVIHRDVKPENVKLMPNGQLILLDFGLAKDSAKSLHGGSLAYAAPEQISEKGTSAQSDLYSYGATLYHLLSGEMPMSAIFRLSDINTLNTDSMKKVHEINPLVPAEISRLIAWSMELNPAVRPARIADFRQSWRTMMQKYLNLNPNTQQNPQTSEPTYLLDEQISQEIAPKFENLLSETTISYPEMLPTVGFEEEKRTTPENFAPDRNPNLPKRVIIDNFNETPTVLSQNSSKKPANTVLLFGGIGFLTFVLLGAGAGVFFVFFNPFNNIPPVISPQNTGNSTAPTSPSVLENKLKVSLYRKTGGKSEKVNSDFIFHEGDEMYFGIETPKSGVLYVVVNDFVEKKLILFYPTRRFPTSREPLKPNREMRYPPIQEIKFGKVDTKDRDYNADKFYFVFAANAESDLVKEIEAILAEEKPVNITEPKAKDLLEKLDKAATETKTGNEPDSAITFATNDKSLVGLLELKSAGK